MNVFVDTLRGPKINVLVPIDATVIQLKQEICDEEGNYYFLISFYLLQVIKFFKNKLFYVMCKNKGKFIVF
jgi:hypothetical protein